MRRWLITLFLLCLPVWAQAATYYVDDAGNDATNNGLSTSAPWKTFAKATGVATACGDTIIVMDGTYTTAVHGALTITKACTVGAPFLVQAENERLAFLSGSGASAVISLVGASYVTISGLRVKETDLSGASAHYIVSLSANATKNTLRNLLISHTNRYCNCHPIGLIDSTLNTIEDNELYSFARGAVMLKQNATLNVVRRNYANSRAYADIPGGLVSGDTTKGDETFMAYPGGHNLFENNISEGNGSGFGIEASSSNQAIENEYYGNMSLTDTNGFLFRERGTTTAFQPQDTVMAHNVAIDSLSNGFYFRGNLNTTCTNCTAYNAGLHGFAIDRQSTFSVPTASVFGTNWLSFDNTNTGLLVSFATTWTMTNTNAFGNGTNYNPSSHANYEPTDTPSAVAHGMGTCRVWRPDGSAAKTNNWGADILYRYQNGVLQDGTGGTTKTPLWDPTDFTFPHGAIVAGVNDTSSTSLYNVNARLNVNSGGCAFPASYPGATPPADPATFIASSGTTSTTHDHDLTAGTDLAVGQCITLFHAGANVGTVNTVTSGGEALTLGGSAVSSPAYRRSYFYYRLNPTTGIRSQAVTTTGNVDAMVTTSMELYNVAAVGTTAGASAQSATPSVSVSIGTGQTIIDCLSAYSGTTLTAGANQTLQKDTAHSSIAQRGAVSTKSSTDGVQVGYTLGTAASWWTLTATPLCAVSCAALTHVLTQVAGQVNSAFMLNCPDNCTVVNLGAVNAASTNVPSGTSFAVSLQTDATVAAAPLAGRKLYVSYNSGAYVPVTDTTTNHLSFHGSTADPTVVSGAVSVNLSGVLTNVPGTTIHSVNVTPFATMTQDDSLVNRWVMKLAPTAVATDTYEFREYTDAGVALDAYGATADAKITVTGTTPGISAPTGLKLVSTSNTLVSLIWTPSTYATLAGYKVYQSDTSGVYGAAVATITASGASLEHTTPTQWSTQTLVGDTYYFVVTAYDADLNESAVSNEVTAVQTGMTARTGSVGGVATARTASTGRDLRGEQSP